MSKKAHNSTGVTMKNPKKQFLDRVVEMDPGLSELAEEIRRDEAAGKLPRVPQSPEECRTWRDAWWYSFYLADLFFERHLKSQNNQVVGVIWVGVDFDDGVVDVLVEIGSRLGDEPLLREMRLVRTTVSVDGVEKLKKLFPNCIFAVYDEISEAADPTIIWWPEHC